MSVRLSNNTGRCGNRVVYGRKSCTPVFEIKTGEIQLVEVDFCDGCNPCDSPEILTAIDPAIETEVLGTDGIDATIKSIDGCVATLLIDASVATPKSRYIVRQTVNMGNCTRLSECFKVNITGDCTVSGACAVEAEDCNKLLGQETVCTDGVAILNPPTGTTHAEVFTTSAIQYMLNGATPAGSPALYANLGCTIPLASAQEIAGFRAQAYCLPGEASFVVTYRGC